MIEWFTRVDPGRVYLRLGDEAVTYGEVVDHLRRATAGGVTALRPSPTVDDVLAILAALDAGGLVALGPEHGQPPAHDLDGAVLVVMTSGASGKPKGVRLTRANLEAAAAASAAHLGHGDEDVWLLAMPLYHVGGLSILVRSAYAGGSVRMLAKFEARAVSRWMRDDVTVVSVVPTMLTRILDHDHDVYSGLRAVLVGGGPIPDGLLERAAAAGLPVMPSYGMTETFGQVATLHPDAPLGYEVHPLPGVEVRIVEQGRIAVRSDQVSPGYLGEPDRADSWFVTGDVGAVDQSGALSVAGRADTLIVSGGENVDPEVVEALVRSHPRVVDVAVVGVPDDRWGRAVGCVYAGDVEVGDLAEWVDGGAAAPHQVPRLWSKVDSVPRDPMGKVQRAKALVLLRS